MTVRPSPWLGASVCFLAVTLLPRLALAMSCIDSAYERMELSLTAVFEGSREVPTPRELGDLDELLNSGNDGRALLLWQTRTMAFSKVYELGEAWAPAPEIAPWMAATAKRKLMTACRYAVAYSPILPGRYRFSQEHMNGSKEPVGIGDPELLVYPGRDRVELRFTLRGRRMRAEYAVLCASFEWDEARVCARSVPSSLPASVEALPEPSPEPPPAVGASVTLAEPTPTAAPAGPTPTAPALPEANPRGGCAGCAVPRRDADAPWILLGLSLLVACRKWHRSG